MNQTKQEENVLLVYYVMASTFGVTNILTKHWTGESNPVVGAGSILTVIASPWLFAQRSQPRALKGNHKAVKTASPIVGKGWMLLCSAWTQVDIEDCHTLLPHLTSLKFCTILHCFSKWFCKLLEFFSEQLFCTEGWPSLQQKWWRHMHPATTNNMAAEVFDQSIQSSHWQRGKSLRSWIYSTVGNQSQSAYSPHGHEL